MVILGARHPGSSSDHEASDSGSFDLKDRQGASRTLSEAEIERLRSELQKDPTLWLVAKKYYVPRKVVVRSMELLDAKDSPDTPGMMLEETFRAMVTRFDSVLCSDVSESRQAQIDAVVHHLKRHTRRRRGEAVLKDGFVEWEQTAKVYDLLGTNLNCCERAYHTVDVGESSAILSQICSCGLIFLIVLSIGAWMVSTMPGMQTIPDSCRHHLTKGKCEPEPHPIFKVIEAVCIIMFTAEYIIRLVTVPFVRFALHDENFMVSLLAAVDPKRSQSKSQVLPESPKDGISGNVPKLKGRFRTWLHHVTAPTNVIDLLAILPWWMDTLNIQAGGGFLVVLRILRLTRIFRVFKFGKFDEVFTVLTKVIDQSLPALLLMVFFICVGCCLFGTLIWFAEQGDWHPQGSPALAALNINDRGAWLRHTGSLTKDDLEESPYLSIIHSFWYVLVTVTTVGYGDQYPTTPNGKLVASIAILGGIIVLAMPIGVVGANFGHEFECAVEERKRKARIKEQLETRRVLEEAEDRALEEEMDSCNPMGDSAEVSTLPDDAANELLRVDLTRTRLIGQAESLEKSWENVLPEVMRAKLSEHLRFFVVGFFGTTDHAPEVTGSSAKPKVEMARLLDLDALSTQVCRFLSAVTSDDELSDFSLKEGWECRRKWFQFMDCCWEYATTMCTIGKRPDPPEYQQMKSLLAARGTDADIQRQASLS